MIALVPTLPPRPSDGTVNDLVATVSAGPVIDCGPGSGMLVLEANNATVTMRQASTAPGAASVGAPDLQLATTEPRAYSFDPRSRFAAVFNPTGGFITTRHYVVRLR